MSQVNVTEQKSIIVNPKIRKELVTRPVNDNHIWNEVDYEVVKTQYSGGELIILIKK